MLGFAPDQEFQVEMIAPIAGTVAVPRYTFEGISYLANFQNVTFSLGAVTDAQREQLPGVVARILALLPHTPMKGVGFNFGFSTKGNNESVADLLQRSPALLDAFPEGAEIVDAMWANRVKWNDALVTYRCSSQGDELILQSNFHYGVTTAPEAQQILARANAYRVHYDIAVGAAKNLTKEDLEA